MKTRLLIPPVLALLICSLWIGSRHQILADLEQGGNTLRKRIAEFRQGGADTKGTHNEAAGAPEWKKLSAQALRANQTSLGFGKMRKRLAELSTDEILAGLEQMGESTSGGDNVLKELLIEALVKKDPKLALDRLIGRVDESGRGGTLSQLADGMKKLATKDPKAAVMWFDRAVADGVFEVKRLDGINAVREELESALVTGLIASDPATAIGRLKAMPEESRGKKLNDYANNPLDEGQQLTFVKMIREVLAESSQHSLISNQANQLVGRGGLAEISEFLARINATSGERTAAVQSAVSRQLSEQARLGSIVPENIDSMRRWVATEMPGSEDRVTGSALNHLAWDDFPKAAALVLKYHEQSRDDVILKSFFEGGADRNWPRDELRAMVEKLRDESLRNEYLNELK